jgi:chemotaxis protein methyltransferase CheR
MRRAPAPADLAEPTPPLADARLADARLADARLTDADFAAIAALLRARTGIVLSESKRELVVGRLNRRLRALGLARFADYLDHLDGPNGEAERGEMVNALTTNLTRFFREPHHFTTLANEVLPPLLAASAARRVRLWSAACSSGEEPYSMAMVLHKALGSRPGVDARILATDIDTNMVAAAAAGRYDPEPAKAIPAEFRRLVGADGAGSVVMSDALRQRIAFRVLNLLGDWPMRGGFDAIFCRNVVIYFDKDTQRALFDRMADILNPRGWLFIGHSESLFRVSDRFENLGQTTYRKLR